MYKNSPFFEYPFIFVFWPLVDCPYDLILSGSWTDNFKDTQHFSTRRFFFIEPIRLTMEPQLTDVLLEQLVSTRMGRCIL